MIYGQYHEICGRSMPVHEEEHTERMAAMRARIRQPLDDPHPSVSLDHARSRLKGFYAANRTTNMNDAVAAGFAGRIIDRAGRTGDVPDGAAARPGLGGGIRLVPLERPAVIVYRVAAGVVEVVNVFYGGRDYAVLPGNDLMKR
jgi:plasmid stabilization system protein ParE